jgi:NTP pyrophosphatase (non-canonical NTP hydrolase)
MADGGRKLKVVISGSFNKHWPQIEAAVSRFEEHGAVVLSPIVSPPTRTVDGFVYLAGDTGTATDIESAHLRAIEQADLLYIVNPGGYLGPSVALEVGYALAWHTPIWSLESFSETPHRYLVPSGDVPRSLESVGNRVIGEFPESATLGGLQAYVKRMAEVRGFSDETPPEIFILLLEEIGELAKALRAHQHLKMSSDDTSAKNIRLELADCLIYVLHFANKTGVNLAAAFREKEELNKAKKWFRP